MALHIFPVFVNVTNLTSSEYVYSSIFSDNNKEEVTSNEDILLMTRLIVQKVCVPVVVLTGVIGNSMSIVVLTRKCMKSSTNSYLTALAIADLLYLVFSFALSLKHHQVFTHSIPYVHCFPFVRVFTDMFANVSVILTVTFTVERYIGVCHPMKGRILCTSQRAKLITAVVSAVAILCTTPEFWEMEVVYKKVDNHTVPSAVYTEFSSRPSYEVGYYWFLVVFFTLLPLVLLCVFNGILISTVIKAAKLRKEMTLLTPVSGIRNGGHSQPKEQQKITKMLIIVVLAFIVCQLPGALLLLVQIYTSLAGVNLTREQQNEMKIAGNITNLLIQTNASINFILYSAISTKFRRVFYRILCKWKTCLSCLQRRSHTSFSMGDGVQLSSLYGDKLGSKTSCSTYTYKVKISQRSPRSDISHTLFERESASTSQKPSGRHARQNGFHTTIENIEGRNIGPKNFPNPNLLGKENGNEHTCRRNLDENSGQNGASFDRTGVCLTNGCENKANCLRISWRGNQCSNCLRVKGNINR